MDSSSPTRQPSFGIDDEVTEGLAASIEFRLVRKGFGALCRWRKVVEVDVDYIEIVGVYIHLVLLLVCAKNYVINYKPK
jgi:hypothetical protein